jgi:PAS domain S-box-containing protein
VLVKLTATAVIAILLLAGVLDRYYAKQMETAAHESLDRRAFAIASGLASECEYGLLIGNRPLLQQAVVKVLSQPDVVSATVLDQSGKIMASAGHFKLDPSKQARAELVTRTEQEISMDLQTEAVAGGVEEFLVPIRLQPESVSVQELSEETGGQPARQVGQKLGLVQLDVSHASTMLRVQQARRAATLITIAVVLGALLFCVWMVRRTVRPLRDLVRGTEHLATGNLDVRVAITTNDEIGDLSHGFNKMAEALQQSHLEILDYQRNLERRVANATAELKNTNVQLLAEIAERKRAEGELRETSRNLQAIIQTSPVAIMEMDSKGYVSMWNPASERVFGWSEEEVLGKFLPIIADDQRMEFEALRRRLIGGERLVGVETSRRRKDGKRVEVSISAAPLYGSDGTVTGIIGVIADMTEHKRLEEQFLQSQKVEAVGRLAGGVAHDFNNILTAIVGYSQLTMYRMAESDPLRANIEEINKAADRAAGLTRQLLAFSRKQILVQKVFDLNSVVANLDKMLRRVIGEDIDFVTKLAPDLGRTKADPGQIEQVMLNMAVNARDAMPQGGKLTIETGNVRLDEDYARQHVDVVPGEYVMLAFSDNGTGMTPDVMKRIFEPFYTTKGIGKGTGLGLATCFGIVKQSGGHITVYSEVGQGTTFKVYLPRVLEELKAETVSQTTGVDVGGHETILLVEDDIAIRELNASVLRKYGYNVLVAKDGQEALSVAECLHGKGLDLVFTDVVMPQMGGRELADRLHAMYPDLKVLFCSGYTEDAIVHRGVLASGIDFLQKPFSPTVLAAKVHEVIKS